jgi:amidohydrolase
VFRGTPLLVQLFLIYFGLGQFEAVRDSVFWPLLREPFACAFMAAEDNFRITVRGSGGHASRPHRCHDAIVCASAIVIELQTIVARVIDPSELAVVSVTEIGSDGTSNAIAGEAFVDGDCRSFSPVVSDAIEAAMRRIAGGIAAAHSCIVEVDYTRVFVPLINDPVATEHAVAAAMDVFGAANLNASAPRMGASGDFAQVPLMKPGCFVNIGNGDTAVCHSPHYDFNDAAIPHGVAFFTTLVRQRLRIGL